MEKLTTQCLMDVATKMEGKCLTFEYTGNHQKYQWECRQGHVWWATYNNIRCGHWCPYCSKRKIVLEDLKKYARSRGGECLSNIYVNTVTRYKWKCQKNHVWESTGMILKDKQWCPYCSGRHNNTVESLSQYAKSLGGEFLSPIYYGLKKKYLWKCKDGHIWETTADNVLHKHSWCPTCFSKYSNLQQEVFKAIVKVFPDVLANQRRILPNKRFELDIYLPSKKRAIEFDGVYWHARPIAQERDRRKENQCNEMGIKLMRIAEMDYIADKDGVIKKSIEFLSAPNAKD